MRESNPPGDKDALVLFLLLQYCEGPCCNGSSVCADKNEHRARLQQITVNAFRLGNFKPSNRWVLATSPHPSLAGVAWQTVSTADTAPDIPATEIPHLLSYFFRVEILALLMGPLRSYMPSCSFHRAPGWNPVRQMRVQQTYPQQKNLPDWGTASSEHKKPSAGETEAPGHQGEGWTWWHQPAACPWCLTRQYLTPQRFGWRRGEMSPCFHPTPTLLKQASHGLVSPVLVWGSVVEYVFIVAWHKKSF